MKNKAGTWQVLVNDDLGSHSPVGFRTRREAEVFACARSFWRQGVNLMVRRAKSDCWSIIYRDGRLHDCNVWGAFDPRKVVQS